MSEVKVNKISPRTACGTVTLGDSGDTFTIPAGATITNNGTAAGFGATGAASWDTTVKTGDFTAVSGVGYFVNSTSGEIDVTLPAGTAGAVVAVADYANTADTNNIILKQNGSDKIEGSTDDFVINQEGSAITLVFVDSTKGWITTDTGNSSNSFLSPFIIATGGTITCSGDYRIHTFTGPGTFSVSNAGTPSGSTTVDYLVVGGGAAGGGNCASGGGGAGGYRESSGAASGSYTVSPLGSGVSALSVGAQSYGITVGAGGTSAHQGTGVASGSPILNNGNASTFLTITSAGGGGGGNYGLDGCTSGILASNASKSGAPGGSGGGGGSGNNNPGGNGGTGNQPPVNPAQGKDGGAGRNHTSPGTGVFSAAGAGGATVAGTPSAPGAGGGAGGAGATSSINGTPTARAGGGGGATCSTATGASQGPGGAGGGGAGGQPGTTGPLGPGVAGTVNTGGGGGGGRDSAGGGGGSGIVIIRYKFQ